MNYLAGKYELIFSIKIFLCVIATKKVSESISKISNQLTNLFLLANFTL